MQFHLILVSPARAENVGAVARAMKTMGFSSLRVVNSQVHQTPEARWVAHASGDILDKAQHFDCLEQALFDIDFTVATTARSRAKYHYYYTPQQLTEQLQEKRNWLKSCALVFGREDSGLTNEELALADVLTGVPMVADYPSLNLGQAVMVFCYQLSAINLLPPISGRTSDENQLSALRERCHRLLSRILVNNDKKLTEWLDQRLGVLEQRDTSMLHTLLHDIEKSLNK